MASNYGIMFSKREGREKSGVGVCTCLLPVLLGQIALFLHSLPVLANVGRMQWIPFLYTLRFDCFVQIVYRFEEVYVLHSGNKERGWNEVSQHSKGKGKGGKCLEWQDVLFFSCWTWHFAICCIGNIKEMQSTEGYRGLFRPKISKLQPMGQIQPSAHIFFLSFYFRKTTLLRCNLPKISHLKCTISRFIVYSQYTIIPSHPLFL